MVNLALISKYRTHLMGVAAIMILLCHAVQYGVACTGMTRTLLVSCNIGVDIFFLLSGVGCYYSLTKEFHSEGKASIVKWYKRRVMRILLPYTIVKVPLWIMAFLLGVFCLRYELIRYTTISYWTKHDADWFIAVLIPLYFLTPLLMRYLQRSHRVFKFLLLILVLFIASYYPNWSDNLITDSVVSNLQCALRRINGFLIGLFIAPFIQNSVQVRLSVMLILAVAATVIYHILFRGAVFYWLCVLPLCLLMVRFFEFAESKKVSLKFLLLMGTISLESYITNVGIRLYIDKSSLQIPSSGIFMGHYLDYLLIIIIGTVVSLFSNMVSNRIFNCISNK